MSREVTDEALRVMMLPRQETPGPHDEATLPLWAQVRLNNLRRDLAAAQADRATMAQAAEILRERRWFTILGPSSGVFPNDVYHLWMLYPDRPHALCDLYVKDILLVGRYRDGDRLP